MLIFDSPSLKVVVSTVTIPSPSTCDFGLQSRINFACFILLKITESSSFNTNNLSLLLVKPILRQRFNPRTCNDIDNKERRTKYEINHCLPTRDTPVVLLWRRNQTENQRSFRFVEDFRRRSIC